MVSNGGRRVQPRWPLACSRLASSSGCEPRCESTAARLPTRASPEQETAGELQVRAVAHVPMRLSTLVRVARRAQRGSSSGLCAALNAY